jgi:RNA polymerase sigma factor (sigma-70 family)
MIRMPVYMNEIISKWTKTKEQLMQKLNRMPHDEEIAKKMKLPYDKIEEINFWLSTKTSSLEARVSEESDSQIIDLVESQTSVTPDAEIEHLLDKERVASLLGKMSRREKEVLDMRFGLPDGKIHTLAEAAKRLGLSRERVRQIEKNALDKLRDFVRQQDDKAYK